MALVVKSPYSSEVTPYALNLLDTETSSASNLIVMGLNERQIRYDGFSRERDPGTNWNYR